MEATCQDPQGDSHRAHIPQLGGRLMLCLLVAAMVLGEGAATTGRHTVGEGLELGGVRQGEVVEAGMAMAALRLLMLEDRAWEGELEVDLEGALHLGKLLVLLGLSSINKGTLIMIAPNYLLRQMCIALMPCRTFGQC